MTASEDLARRMELYREATADRDGLVLEAFSGGYSKRDISKRTGINRATVIAIIQRQEERDMKAAKTFSIGDEVSYGGDLPDDWARDGEVEATEDDASGTQVVTVLFSDGHRQDILSTELEFARAES